MCARGVLQQRSGLVFPCVLPSLLLWHLLPGTHSYPRGGPAGAGWAQGGCDGASCEISCHLQNPNESYSLPALLPEAASPVPSVRQQPVNWRGEDQRLTWEHLWGRLGGFGAAFIIHSVAAPKG